MSQAKGGLRILVANASGKLSEENISKVKFKIRRRSKGRRFQ
jgi:hypothetical protein